MTNNIVVHGRDGPSFMSLENSNPINIWTENDNRTEDRNYQSLYMVLRYKWKR